MRRLVCRLAPGLALMMLLGTAARAGAEEEPADESLRSEWSITAIGQYTRTESPENDGDVGGWFDQYEFTPNKGTQFPFQIGIREAAFDLFRGPLDTPVFQLRLASPTANLGISGSQADDAFFDQRLDALTRLDGLEVDLHYWRMRTEQLRIFPNTEGSGLVFDDRTRASDRFYRDRTGFSVEGRARPGHWLEEPAWLARIQPELSLRGGYEARDGRRQQRFIRGPSNSWLGVGRGGEDRGVGEVGAGLLVAPDGLLTLSLDFDYEELQLDDPVFTEGDLGFAAPEASRTVGFIPETERYTGSVRFNSRLGERAVIEGGFIVSRLEQVSRYTPDQRAAGLRDNHVWSFGANAAYDVQLTDALSLNGVVKYDRRKNDIDRTTPLFNSSNQIAPFVQSWERVYATSELALRFRGANRAAIGVRYEDVARDLDFASPGAAPRVLPENALVDRDTRIATLYGRGSLRPWRRLRVDGELGYRWAPETGYATELDDNLYGEARASYTFAFERPLLVSASLRGGTGENDDVTMVSGQGPVPDGTRLPRNFERSHFRVGVTATQSPIDRLSLSASLFYARDDQDASLDLSDLQRYFQDNVPIDFVRDGTLRFENHQLSLVLGLFAELTEKTDGSFSYSFTHAKADYGGSDETTLLGLVDSNQEIDSNTHVLDFELRHRVMAGLELLGGYRFQKYGDNGQTVPQSVASVVRPRSRSTGQHTVTVGVTLTSEFFAAP